MQVLETNHQVGRVSVSTPNDMPYKEMAGQCEALQMGKQKKISTFMTAQHRQESSIRISCDYNKEKEEPSSSSSIVQLGFPLVLPLLDMSYQFMQCTYKILIIFNCLFHSDVIYKIYLKLQSGNPFLISDFNDLPQYSSVGTGPMLCSTVYQQNFFQLPTSSPYDNFLKAASAGC